MTRRYRLACSATMALLAVSSPLVAAHHARITGTPANRLADEVLHSLVSSPMGKAAPPRAWEVILIDDPRINAYVDGTGYITVTAGMASLLGTERGLWAGVLGHEIGHFVVHQQFQAYLPGFQAELEKAYRESRAAEEKPGASAPVHLVPLGGGSRKTARKREDEADRAGLMLMAQAGYHPDFVIVLDRLFHSFFGDEPKLTEYLSSHPRWAERERRAERDRAVALAIFESRWPDAAKSPGGLAPAFGAIRAVAIDEGGAGAHQLLTLHVPVELRNAGSRQIRVEAVFLDNGHQVPSTVPELRGTNGSLVLNVTVEHVANGSASAEVVLRVPTADLATKNPRLKAEVFLIADDQVLDLASKPFELLAAGN